jgi:hypothetical protein
VWPTDDDVTVTAPPLLMVARFAAVSETMWLCSAAPSMSYW